MKENELPLSAEGSDICSWAFLYIGTNAEHSTILGCCSFQKIWWFAQIWLNDNVEKIISEK